MGYSKDKPVVGGGMQKSVFQTWELGDGKTLCGYCLLRDPQCVCIA